ncbi:hypothetical protein BJX99DRAFT_226867 [Aspergillus californicus]
MTNRKLVRLCDLTEGGYLQIFQGHANRVMVITFAHDGNLLASASGEFFRDWVYSQSDSLDNSLRLWSTLTGECLYLLGDIPAISSLSFSADNQYLRTSLGTLELDRSGDNRLKVQHDGFFVKRDWVTHNGQNFLWLPPEYRPRETAVCDNVVVLVCGSRQLVFLDFSLD